MTWLQQRTFARPRCLRAVCSSLFYARTGSGAGTVPLFVLAQLRYSRTAVCVTACVPVCSAFRQESIPAVVAGAVAGVAAGVAAGVLTLILVVLGLHLPN